MSDIEASLYVACHTHRQMVGPFTPDGARQIASMHRESTTTIENQVRKTDFVVIDSLDVLEQHCYPLVIMFAHVGE